MEASGSSTGSPAGCKQPEMVGGVRGSGTYGFKQPQDSLPGREWARPG